MRASLIILGVFGIGVVGFACVANLMPYDAYVYLSCAWSFLDEARPFSVLIPNFRQPVFALWLSPCLIAAAENPDGFALSRLPYLMAAGVTIAFAATAWMSWHSRLSQRGIVLAALFFTLNPVLIHYGAMPMHDVPAGLLLQVALLFWMRWRDTGHWLPAVCTAACCSVLIGMRLNLGIIVPALVVATGICEWRRRRDGVYRRMLAPIGIAAASIVAGFALMIGLYAWADASWAAGPERVAALFRELTSIPPFPTDPIYEYAWSLAIIGGGVVVLLPVGVICCFRNFLGGEKPGEGKGDHKLDDGAVGILVVTVVVILTQTIVIGHNEIRYLLPVAGGMAWVCALAMDELWQRIPTKAGVVAFVVLVFSVPIYQTGREIIRLSDPVYRTPYVAMIGQAMREAREDGRPVYWHGNTHPIAPKDYLISRYDEYYGVWHVGGACWYLATGTTVRHIGDLPREVLDDSRRQAFLLKERALVVQGRLEPYYTQDLIDSGVLPPIRLRWFDADGERSELKPIPGW